MCSKNSFYLALLFSVLAIAGNDFNRLAEAGDPPDFYSEFLSRRICYTSKNFIGLCSAFTSIVLRLFSLEKLTIKITTSYSENNYFDVGPNDVTVSQSASQRPDHDLPYPSLSDGSNVVNSSTLVNVDESKLGDKRPKKNDYYSNYRGICMCECGELRVRIKRIIGGRDSSYGSHPWQAALFKPTFKRRPYCGGALLTDRWIITAAHCVDNKPIKILTVRLGELNARGKKQGDLLNRRQYKVDRKEVHPEYSVKRHRHDIALLKLDRTVNFDDYIVPICLPNQGLDLIGRTATVAGWGRRKNNEEKSSPAILNEVQIEVIPNEVCQRWFSEAGHTRKINDIFLCAGHSSGGRDSCKGDSGGPLTTSVNGREVLIGIVSWGLGCGKKHSPGVYTNIKKFVPWIAEFINE